MDEIFETVINRILQVCEPTTRMKDNVDPIVQLKRLQEKYRLDNQTIGDMMDAIEVDSEAEKGKRTLEEAGEVSGTFVTTAC